MQKQDPMTTLCAYPANCLIEPGAVRCFPFNLGIRVTSYPLHVRTGEIKAGILPELNPTRQKQKSLCWKLRVLPSPVLLSEENSHPYPLSPDSGSTVTMTWGGGVRRWSRLSQTVVKGIGSYTLGTNTLTLLRCKFHSRKPLFQWQSFVPLTLSLNHLPKNAFVKFQEMGLITINLHFCAVF